MNGIPKGLCSFGGVQRRRLWSGQGPTALAGFKRAGHGHFFPSGEPTGNDDVHTTGEGTPDGLECLAPHDYGPSESLPLEELEVFGNMPQELVVFSYGIVVSYRYYDVLLHRVRLLKILHSVQDDDGPF